MASSYRRPHNSGPPLAYLNTRWGREDYTASRNGPSNYRNSYSSASPGSRNTYYPGKTCVALINSHSGADIQVRKATRTTPAYLAELRSPTKKTVARTTPPRSFSPRGGTRTQNTLRHKPHFEGRPPIVATHDTTKAPNPSTATITSSSKPTTYQPPRHEVPASTTAHVRPKVETKTTYLIRSPNGNSQSIPTTRPSASSPYNMTTSTTPQTRLYRTSSSPGSHSTARSTPVTTPSSGSMAPFADDDKQPPALRSTRGTKISEYERKHRRMGYFGNTPSPPSGWRRAKSPPGTSPFQQIRLPLCSCGVPQTYLPALITSNTVRATTRTTAHAPAPTHSSTTNPTPHPDTSTNATAPNLPSTFTTFPTARTKPTPVRPSRPESTPYRYPSLSKGTAATPKRPINAGMVPIDTTLPSKHDSTVIPRFLRESRNDAEHSKYPGKQREGVVVHGDKEKAFKGWLGGLGKSSKADRWSGYGTARKLDVEGRDAQRRMKRRGKGVWFWEWTPC